MIDYASTAIKKISAIVFGLASAALLARYLGAEGRGQYAIVVSTSAVIVSIMNLGVSNYYTFERRKLGVSLARSYVLFFILLFVVLFFVGVLAIAWSTIYNVYAFGCLLSSFALLRMQTQSVLLVEDVKGATIASVMGAACETTVLAVCYLLFDRYVFLAVGALVTKEIVITVASALRLRNFPGERRSVWPIGAQLLSNGRIRGVVAVFILTALITINYKIDALVLAFLGVPAAQIGVYALGVAVSEYLWIFSDIFKDVQVSRTARGGSAQGVARDLRMAIALTLVGYAAFLSTGWFLVKLVFGEQFSHSYIITLSMLGATIFMVPCKLIGVYYISMGRFHTYICAMALAVVANIVMNLIFVPLLGVYGAVLASVVSYGIAGIWMLLDFSAISSIPIYRALVLRSTDVTQILLSLRERWRAVRK